MNITATQPYTVNSLTGLLTHSFWRNPLARDAVVEAAELDAQALSGDYFVMLASRLDTLNRNSNDYETKLALENIVSDLIYLQDHYRITKNKQTES